LSPPATDLSIAEIVTPKGEIKDSDAKKQKCRPERGGIFVSFGIKIIY